MCAAIATGWFPCGAEFGYRGSTRSQDVCRGATGTVWGMLAAEKTRAHAAPGPVQNR